MEGDGAPATYGLVPVVHNIHSFAISLSGWHLSSDQPLTDGYRSGDRQDKEQGSHFDLIDQQHHRGANPEAETVEACGQSLQPDPSQRNAQPTQYVEWSRLVGDEGCQPPCRKPACDEPDKRGVGGLRHVLSAADALSCRTRACGGRRSVTGTHREEGTARRSSSRTAPMRRKSSPRTECT